jgi:hypothetical protein
LFGNAPEFDRLIFPVVPGSFKRPTSRKLHYRLRRVAAGVFALPGECSETVHPGTANPA